MAQQKKSGKKQAGIRDKRKRTGIVTVSIEVIVLCGVLLFNSFRLSNQLSDYAAVEANLQQQIEEQLNESEQLDKESEYVKTEEYIEQVARDRLGLLKKNEIRFEKESE